MAWPSRSQERAPRPPGDVLQQAIICSTGENAPRLQATCLPDVIRRAPTTPSSPPPWGWQRREGTCSSPAMPILERPGLLCSPSFAALKGALDVCNPERVGVWKGAKSSPWLPPAGHPAGTLGCRPSDPQQGRQHRVVPGAPSRPARPSGGSWAR